MGWVEEYKANRYEVKKRLEACEKELEHIYDGMNANNVLDRVNRRNELMIMINNLRTWLGLNYQPSAANEPMKYNIRTTVPIL